MADYNTILNGGFTLLAEFALPSIATSANWLTSAPAGTKRVVVTFRGAGVTLRWNGSAATAGANGVDYPEGSYEFDVNNNQLAGARAIEDGGTVTGWVQCFG